MTDQSERLIALKGGLSERELHILHIELDRQRKSTGVTYGLWFFLSWLGLHKFYLGRIAAGVLYVVAPWVLIFSLFSGILAAEASPEAGGGAALILVSLLALCAYGIWWLVDLFTIPGQVRACNESLEMKIIASLNAGRGAPGRSMRDDRPA